MAKEINIAKDIVAKYETKDIIAFVTKKLKDYNKGSEELPNGSVIYHPEDAELQLYIDILIALDHKLNGDKPITVIS